LPTIRIVNLSCTDSNPRQFASYAIPFGLCSYPSDTDHRIEFPTTDCSHAVIATKLTRFRIRIAVVRPFIDECSHRSKQAEEKKRRRRRHRYAPDATALRRSAQKPSAHRGTLDLRGRDRRHQCALW